MKGTWRQWALIAVLGLALGLGVAAPTMGAPPKGSTGLVERRRAADMMGRAERGSREFPTPGMPFPNLVSQGVGTASGGAYIQGLGTVSHASIDNNWARLR